MSESSAGDVMTQEEAAAYLRLSSRHVRRLVRSGELSTVTVGRRVLYRKSVLDAFLDNHEKRDDGR